MGSDLKNRCEPCECENYVAVSNLLACRVLDYLVCEDDSVSNVVVYFAAEKIFCLGHHQFELRAVKK